MKLAFFGGLLLGLGACLILNNYPFWGAVCAFFGFGLLSVEVM